MSGAPDDRESQRRAEVLAAFLASRPTEDEYLRKIEALAQAVGRAAYEEFGAVSFKVEDAKTPLQQAIAELSCNLRMYHYEGDGCVDDH